MKTAYFLRTQRLGFRPWAHGDLPLAIGLWGDPEVTKLIGGPFSQVQVQARLAREIASMNEHGVQYWPIFLLLNNEHVGCCGLRPYKPEQGIFELGFHLRTAYQGQGLAVEAARTVMAYAFGALNAKALFAGHHPANAASRRVLEKLGFRYIRDELYAPTGLNHPSYLLSAQEFARKLRADTQT